MLCNSLQELLLRIFSQPCSLPGSPSWIYFEPNLKKFARPSKMSSFRALLSLEHGLYLLDVGIVYVIAKNWIHYNVPCTKLEARIGVRYFMREVESCLCSSSHGEIPCPRPFVHIATEVKAQIQIPHIELIDCARALHILYHICHLFSFIFK